MPSVTSRATYTSRPHALLRKAVLIVLILLISMATAALTFPVVSAQQQGSVGVTPATASFIDPPLVPGGTSQVVLQFQQRYSEPVNVHAAVVPVDSDIGDPHEWLRLDRSGSMMLAPGMHPFTVQIAVPETAPNGMYKAGIAFQATPPDPTVQEGSSATTESSVTATILIQVDNENEVKRIQVEGPVTIHPTEEEAPLRVSLPIGNTGNVDVIPAVRIEIQDQMQRNVLKEFTVSGSLLRPGQVQDQTFAVQKHGLERGQYWITVSTLLDGEPIAVSKAQPFDVLAPGELARVAELRSIRIDGELTRVTVGQMVKLTAVVVNVGQGALIAGFEGEVLRDGTLIEGLESKPVEIAAGETGNLTMLYRISESGKYEFKGRAFYGSKVTEEKSVLLTAESESAAVPSVGFGAATASILGVLLVMVAIQRRGSRSTRTR